MPSLWSPIMEAMTEISIHGFLSFQALVFSSLIPFTSFSHISLYSYS